VDRPRGRHAGCRPVAPRGHNDDVVRAVIFDFYGTLARWADGNASYASVFSDHGYIPDATVLDGYFSLYNGIEHGEHSVSEEAYEAWVRLRLRQLARDGGVDDADADAIVEALRSLDQGEMVAYPEAAATLGALRDAGLTVGVCSNWGWELNAYLEQVGLLALVDSSVTSARAGARKPHPNIYRTSVESLGVVTSDVVFVGDSWEPDVRGPRREGMTAVHVWREAERQGFDAPELEDGDRRVSDLSGVLEIVGLN
jgi:putative hydrolase of the HAD superfamily